MSEEKIWVEDDILITSLNTHENTNMAGEPNLSESGVKLVHGGYLLGMMMMMKTIVSQGVTGKNGKMQDNMEINFQTLSITSLSECF